MKLSKHIFSCLFMLSMMSVVLAQGKKDLISANNALGSGDIATAIEMVDSAMEDAELLANPKLNAKAYTYKGKIYARALMDSAYTNKPENAMEIAKSSLMKAFELDGSGKYEKEIFGTMDQLSNYAFNTGVVNIKAEKYDKAFAGFSESVNIIDFLHNNKYIANRDTIGLLYKGITAYEIGKKDEAKMAMRSVIDMGYKNPFPYEKLVEFAKREDSSEREGIIAEARKLYPESQFFMIEELNYYLSKGEGEKVLDQMIEAADADPENLSLRLALASIYDNLGQTDNALTEYEKVLAKDPKSFDALYSIGTMFFNKGKGLNDAMNELDFNEQAKYNELKGQRDELFKKANPYFAQAAEVNPDDANTQRALKQIKLIIGEF